MDIKLKSYKGNLIVKIIAFVLCVVLFISTILSVGFMSKSFAGREYSGNIEDFIWSKDYEQSLSFQYEFDDKLNEILDLLNNYKSEEYIKSGKTIDPNELEQEAQNLFYNGESYYAQPTNHGDEYSEVYSTSTSAAPYERYGEDYGNTDVQMAFKEEYKEQISQIQENMILEDVRQFKELQKELSKVNGFTYYATDGTHIISNLDLGKGGTATDGALIAETPVESKNFTNKPAYLFYENGECVKVPAYEENENNWLEAYDAQIQDRLDSQLNDKLTIYFAFDEEFLAAKQIEFQAIKGELTKWIPTVATCGILTLALFIYLLIGTGRKDEAGNYKLYKLDGLFIEIQLAIIAIAAFGGGFTFLRYLGDSLNYRYYTEYGNYISQNNQIIPVILAAFLGMCVAAVGLWFILSCVRNLKAGTFLKNLITFRICHYLYLGVKEIYFGGSLMRKVVLVTLAICLLSATVFFAPVIFVLIVVFAPKWVKMFEDIQKGVKEVKSGNLSYKINIQGEGELAELAKGINEISAASNLAIQNELKNQRLKTDLISNVSHDLKTPLTSIITYVDLLKKEGLTCDDAEKYLDILDQKSQRLQKLTEDLFDAAKASSGAIPVRFEKVEMLSLINQGLGELSLGIKEANLDFKISADKEKYYVYADGQLLWRVVENLLGNVLKYAQEGSRVYIDLKEQKGVSGKLPMVVMEIKNISKNELNIEADELMERFKRGDESRNTEGSGLGLAIAKDLVRLQKGWFELKIDGDLFKAVTMLESYESKESDAIKTKMEE